MRSTLQVWAHEYFPSIHLAEPPMESATFPRALRWVHCKSSETEKALLVDYYRIKLRELLFNEVLWSTWGNDCNLPTYVCSSLRATRRRMLFPGPDGAAWYLAERVSVQSLGTTAFLIPKHPPSSMLVKDSIIEIALDWTEQGMYAIEFIDEDAAFSYDEYREQWLTSKAENTIESSNNCICLNTRPVNDEDDLIPMPPWTLLVPSTIGGPNVISIPTNIEIQNLEIPEHVQHISIRTVRKLLQMIAGMQHILIENLTDARQTLRDYAAIIQRLRNQLLNRDNNVEHNNEADSSPTRTTDNEDGNGIRNG
ncbi:hypothetical protein TorRG33x02_104970 [Trema orientale]|uniref:Aminotransferase-like mobile domain containing protein n=1 Tax=Trema orientale TaxID=63057 RepID=A0A2P5F7L8_TREOI|nr:hypothetical protein TorRG33x02_104970 [Trema orientale]